LFISGSAPLPPAVWQQFKRRFDSEILEVYGTSETGRIASNLLNDRQPGSPGELLPGVRVKIDKKSEVLVKSPGVIDGYYKNPRATADSMAQDGWWRTSDTGQLNGRRLILKGRLHEKIRRLGYSLSPRDIEWALHKMPQIKEVQVLSVQRPDSDDDKLICYVVTDASTEAVRDFCKQNLPSVWRPDEINILPSLPRNRSGKVDIVKLKAMEGVRK
jgi:acyl-CoA synthetase (AMP-forming)/AMP-acid ligase II